MGKKQERKVQLPSMVRAAVVQPKTLNEESRTVEVVWTTGARVKRSGWDGSFYEELGLEKKNVRMGRLQNGAPVLNSHNSYDLNDVIGVVESAELIDGKEGRAVLKFSSRENVEPIYQDIKSGILRNISVGYSIHRFEKIEEVDDVPVFRATDWEPMEISVVPAGADDASKIRSEKQDLVDCIVLDETTQVDEPTEIDQRNEPENDLDSIPDDKKETHSRGEKIMDPKELAKLAQEAKTAEKKRQNEIRSIGKKVGLDDKTIDQWIEDDKTVDEVRALAIETLAAKDKNAETETRSTNVEVGEDLSRKGRIEGMSNALLHRFRPKTEWERQNGKQIKLEGYEISDAGRAYAYLSLIDMARACLEANGVRTTSMPKHVLADTALKMRSMHSLADFPEILANVAGKTLRAGYLAAPQTWRPFTNEVTAVDFKEISRTNLGDAPDLLEVPEGGEVKRGSMSEAAEKYRVKEYARIVAITRKVIVNDDLGAFTRVPERMGRAAADLESDLVWAIVTANANLADGFALFSAQHGNLSTAPAVPSEAGLTEMRKSMRLQTGLDGRKIGIIPMMTFVPPSQETAMEKILTQINPNAASGVSAFSPTGRTPLMMDVEPRLEDASVTAWFGMASKDQVDMVELARLEGTDGPMVQSRDGWDVAGVEIKVNHDVGAKAIDFRGMFKNNGV